MKVVNLTVAKTHLSRLVDDAAAGEDIVIARAGKPVVRLVPVAGRARRRSTFGSLKGKIQIAEDFDAPLPASTAPLLAYVGDESGRPEVFVQGRTVRQHRSPVKRQPGRVCGLPLTWRPPRDPKPALSSDTRETFRRATRTGGTQAFPAGGRWQVSTGGGTAPRWRRDGRELYFVAPDRMLMAMPVDTAGGFRAGVAVPLFRTAAGVAAVSGLETGYAPAPDGQRFLVAEPDMPPLTISVVTNWTSLLRK